MPATVLLFERDPDIRVLVSDLLTARGYRVALAESFEHARSLVEAGGVDLFLSDSDGAVREQAIENYTTYGRLIGSKVPMVLFTGHSITPEQAVEFGCVDVIDKPFDVHDLLSRVAANLRQS